MGLLERIFGKRKKETKEQDVYQNFGNENISTNDRSSFKHIREDLYQQIKWNLITMLLVL